MKVSYQLTWPVFALLLLLASLSYLLDFNGLYGQDAHEFLRQSRELLRRLRGMPPAPGGMGDAEMAGGYPLLGALLQLTGLDGIPALQIVVWGSAACALWLFELNLRVLSPGARAESRWIFGMLALSLSPFFLRSGLSVMSDIPGLALLLAALFFALQVIELERYGAVAGFAVFAALAVNTRYALAALLALPALALTIELWRTRQFRWLALAIAAGLLAFLPFFWLKSGAPKGPLGHSLLHDWSLLNLFRASFTQANGTVRYFLPNIVYLFYPLIHPGFCLTLPALFLLGRRTDAALYAKRLLLLSVLLYLLFLGGLSLQSHRYLLPAYGILLLLFFPAWDRFFAYGLYFFKRLTYALLGLTLLCQVFFSVWYIRPLLARNHLEKEAAEILADTLPPDAEVFAFDLDIALQTYLPGVRFRNLYTQRYDHFPAGSYILFNESKLRDQWAGQNPMLNWEHARSAFELQEYRPLPDGWMLYRVINSK
ncbi:MAG: hypothetical protein L6Q97_14340 [Thermoanaerobaculia bacterium]|nr:hypothetical protein [Thermoanaerobaculia bacterium]